MATKSDNVLIKTALKKVNRDYDLKETLGSLQASRVYPAEGKVVIVISDFRKFSFSTKELG